jgi:hypothetical protein
MAIPELKQFGELLLSDFQRHPVWVSCHTADYGEPWYEETDEETFRPWTRGLPAIAPQGALIVRAKFEIHDGNLYHGFVTPGSNDKDLATMQPQMFVGHRRFSFWGGLIGIPLDERHAFYRVLGKGADAIFPVRFSADPNLAPGVMAGQMEGFYRWNQSGTQVEY